MKYETVKCMRCSKIFKRVQATEKPRSLGLCPKCKRRVDAMSGLIQGRPVETLTPTERVRAEREGLKREMGDTE